jgi:hypothetical protein
VPPSVAAGFLRPLRFPRPIDSAAPQEGRSRARNDQWCVDIEEGGWPASRVPSLRRETDDGR